MGTKATTDTTELPCSAHLLCSPLAIAALCFGDTDIRQTRDGARHKLPNDNDISRENPIFT